MTRPRSDASLGPSAARAEVTEERRHVSDSAALVEDGLVTVAEAAAFLRLSRSNLYTLMERGELPFVKLGRSRRIPRRALVELAARGLRGGTNLVERP